MTDKQKKIVKIIVGVLLVILVGEIIFFTSKYFINRGKYVFYTVENRSYVDGDNRVAVGFSDYRHSKFNKYTDGYSKPTVFVYEKDKLVKEIGIKLGYNGYFYDVIKDGDNYIAVGSIQMSKLQYEDKASEGIIVKFDKNFKVIWRKNLSILGKTEFLKVKKDNDKYVVIGTSVYSEGYVGNHTTGGGILVTFDYDGNKKLVLNNGGPYTGKFNDVLIENDGYVVVGLGRSNSGIIVKYNKNGKKLWSSSYGYTDENGISAIERFNNNYVLVSTKKKDKNEKKNYDAVLLVYDKNGKKIDESKYSSSDITYFTDILVLKDDIYAVGVTGKLERFKIKSDSIIVKFDKDLFDEKTDVLKGNNNDYFGQIELINNKINVFGYSNSKLREFKVNGYDYSSFVKIYSKDLK